MKRWAVVLSVLCLWSCASGNVFNELNAPKPAQKDQFELGLAFGGGGVRGFMHLGVIKALAEEGIKPDVVSGTSAGSIAAVFYASGMEYPAMEAAILQVELSDIASFSFSSKGLIQGKKLSDWVNRHIKFNDISDFPIPVAVTATNLSQQKTVMIGAGNPGHAVQTSSTIPGAFVAVENQGDILVDGGVLSVVPVHTARALGAKKVIAVDIYCHNQPKPELTATKVTVAAFRMQSCQLSQDEINSADVIIRPDHRAGSGEAFNEKRQAIEAGYQATKAVMAEIKTMLAR